MWIKEGTKDGGRRKEGDKGVNEKGGGGGRNPDKIKSKQEKKIDKE